MNEKDFRNLKRGDVVQNLGNGKGYIVGGNYGDGGVLLIDTLLASNAVEWKLVSRSEFASNE